jgi:hypothetical protein
MSYESKILEYDKEHIYIVEVELDYCSRSFADGTCVGGERSIVTIAVATDDFSVGDEIQGNASGAVGYIVSISGTSPTYTFNYRITNGSDFTSAAETITNNTATGSATKNGSVPTLVTTGDGKCLNTFGTCQSLTNYDKTEKTYRFCEDRSPHPIGINAIPSLKTINISPAKIDIEGGMGERSNVSLSFTDHPHSDIDIDKYVSERSWDPLDRGQFWTKLRARNPNYQFRPVRVLTGYLEGNNYIAENFKTRNYVIDKLEVTGGTANITGKDPLKRAAQKKAFVPTPNTGTLVADINDSVTSFTVTPSGIGNSEYAASGSIAIGGNEVCDFTRGGDVFTITRGDRGTTASAHSAGAIVQQCYVQNAEVNIIAKDLLTNFASIPAAFINDAEWQLEVDTYLNGLLDGIITKPTDVFKVFEELTEAKPFYIYWDEINQEVKFVALKPPPTSANVINMNSGIVSGSFKTKDLIDMRFSTINYTFGQIDPTKSNKDLENFTQTVTRIDTDSINKYETNQIKNLVSRWINSGNKATALNAAQLLGRRFSDIPREISFSLEAKDSALSLGQTTAINHRDILDGTGSPVDTIFQVISAKEDNVFEYTCVEYIYGPSVVGDNDIDVDTILFSIDEQNVDLRTRYESLIGVPTASTTAVFEVQAGIIIGSSSVGSPSMTTGAWPAGATVKLINKGYIVGHGGDGGTDKTGSDGQDAGDAISLGFALTVNNFGIIGGGGGGSSSYYITPRTDFNYFGSGGAGNTVGISRDTNLFYHGTLEKGGYAGGDLGEDAAIPSGALTATGTQGLAGKAIDLNGFTLTITPTVPNADVRGAVS